MFPSPAIVALLQNPAGQQPVQFITWETLFTAAGATTAVITVTTVLHSLAKNFPARWFALGFSIFLTLVGIGAQNQKYGPATILLALINALVIYAAAVGVNNVSTSPTAPGGAAPPAAPGHAARSYRWWP